VIEDAEEEAVGEEEVKFLKRDLKRAPAYIGEFVKFTVTGNVKQLEKILTKEKIKGAEHFCELRGLQVKTFDHQNELIDTMQWNPLHFAIKFRQIKTVQFFQDKMRVNLKLAMEESAEKGKRVVEQPYLFGFRLCCLAKDKVLLLYLFELPSI